MGSLCAGLVGCFQRVYTPVYDGGVWARSLIIKGKVIISHGLNELEQTGDEE
jgi:hypothetical protein